MAAAVTRTLRVDVWRFYALRAMNVLSNMEEHWRRFPELQRLFTAASLPDDFYHHGGLKSPYTTAIDDLHDITLIAAVVGRGVEVIRIATERAATEEHTEHVARMKMLLRELDHLVDHLRGFAEGFLRERIEELRHQQDVLHRALSQAEEEEYRRRSANGLNA